MRVTLSTNPSPPLAGTVTVTATAEPASQASTITRVEFRVDGVLRATDTSSPFSFSWNTTTESEGQHQLRAMAFYPRNKSTGGVLDVLVKNNVGDPEPPPPQDVPVNTGAPTINDTTPTEGQTLTIYAGTWTNSPDHYTYQWLRGTAKAPIPSATGASYTCGTADVGEVLRCSVTAWNLIGPSAPAETAATSAVASLGASAPVLNPGGTPVLSGAATQGSTLSVSNGSWTNQPTSYTRQWKRCTASPVTSSINNGDTIISGQTWTVTTDASVSLVEFYADGNKLGEDTSSPFQQVVTLSNGAHNLGLVITPTGGVRTELSDSGVNGRFAAVTVSAGPVVVNGAIGTVISGATAATYTLTPTDVGKVMRCLVTAVNATGSSIPVQTEESSVVIAAPGGGDPPTGAYFVEDFEGTHPFPRWSYEPAYNSAYHRIVAGVSGNAIELHTNEGSPGPNPTSNGSVMYLGANTYPHAGWEDALGGRTNTHDTWYRVYMRITSPYTPSTNYNWLVEWHVDNETQSTGNRANSSALGVDSTSNRLYLRPGGGQQSSPTYKSHLYPGTLQLDHWYDLVFHWRWHPSATVGFYAAWVDGQVAVPQQNFPTLYTNVSGNIGYCNFDLQNYHGTLITDVNVQYDSVRIGPTAASVGFTP